MPQGGGSGESRDAGSGSSPGTGPAGAPQGQPYERPQYEQPQYEQPQYEQAQYEQAQYGQPPYGQGAYGQQPPAYGGGGAMQGRPISPVNEIETRVTGRRIVQYIVDIILYGIVGSLISFALDRGHGVAGAILFIIMIVVQVAWYSLYWANFPYARNGQTIGMSLLGVRVISRDGGSASLMQLFARSILLVLFAPLSLLVGIITMMCSRYRQRVGDHLAQTMVVRASVTPSSTRQEFAGAGQSGSR